MYGVPWKMRFQNSPNGWRNLRKKLWVLLSKEQNYSSKRQKLKKLPFHSLMVLILLRHRLRRLLHSSPPLLPNGCSHFVTNSNPESSKVIYHSGNESTPCYPCCKRFPCSTG